jgi:hypothetical protein
MGRCRDSFVAVSFVTGWRRAVRTSRRVGHLISA